jgi:sRNA-binding protein
LLVGYGRLSREIACRSALDGHVAGRLHEQAATHETRKGKTKEKRMVVIR